MNQATAINLMSFSGPTMTQGSANTCFPLALAASMTLFMNVAGQSVPELSITGLYTKILGLSGIHGVDAGTGGWGIYAAMTYGLAPASIWPNDAAHMFVQPPMDEVLAGHEFRAAHFTDYGAKFESQAAVTWTIKEALSHGNSVMLAFQVQDWFSRKSGPLATQQNAYVPGVNSNAVLGSHEVVIVAADDVLNGGSYIIQTWGQDWGDNGFGTLRYDQLVPSSVNNISVIDQIYKDGAVYDNLWISETLKVSQLYNALLNRAPDHDGLAYWVGELKNGVSLESVANGFLGSTEYADLLPGNETDAETDHFFNMTLLGYDTTALNYAGGSKAQFVIAALGALADDARIENRADISQLYAMAMHGNDVSVASVVLVGITSDPQSVQTVFAGLH